MTSANKNPEYLHILSISLHRTKILFTEQEAPLHPNIRRLHQTPSPPHLGKMCSVNCGAKSI